MRSADPRRTRELGRTTGLRDFLLLAMTRSPYPLASVMPIGYNYGIRPVGYTDKISWLHFSET
jgi:hypothetical protein